MIVYVYPADPYGCGEYRLAMPARAAIEAAGGGADVRLIMPADRDGIGGAIDTRTNKLVELKVPPDADVVVLQRVAYSALAQAVPKMRARGIAVVVDMDDDLRRIDPSNPAWHGFRLSERLTQSRSDQHSAANTELACRDATMVTVSTPALLRVYANHGRGRVLENRVPASYLSVPHQDANSVGWGGSIHSHPHDLAEVGPAVARVVRNHGVEYWGAGPDFGRHAGDDALRTALGLNAPGDERYDVETTGNVSMADWPMAVATMGIGLAPLADTAFNRAKSWLKPLEYMAVGVPWVGSPRAEYARLAKLTGVGQLAATPREWYGRLCGLVTDPRLRDEQSNAGRFAIIEHDLTYEASHWRWLEVWADALALQRGHARAATVIA